MYLLVDEKIIKDYFSEMAVKFQEIKRHHISGYGFCYESSCFYLEQDEEVKQHEFIIVTVAPEDVYELEKYQSPIDLVKKSLYINEESLDVMDVVPYGFWEDEYDDDDIYTYFLRNDVVSKESLNQPYGEIKTIASYKRVDVGTKQRLMDNADILLMIPGKLSKDFKSFDAGIKCVPREITRAYIDNLDERIQEEYRNDYVKGNLKRYELGDVLLEIKSDIVERESDGSGRNFKQRGVATLVLHTDTELCILEILVPNCYIGGNKLLNYYFGNGLTFYSAGIEYATIDDYMYALGIDRYGEKKSIVFAYGKVEKKELVLALANEEYTMGELSGKLYDMANNNIAEYNTAEVYVSPTTMVQSRNRIHTLYENRLQEQSIEIFFVELVLFLDAAIEELFAKVCQEQDAQMSGVDPKTSLKRAEDMNLAMSKAMRFSDFSQFLFPTVRKSAKEVAKAFDIDGMLAEYKSNKVLLDDLVKANVRRTNEEENQIKNKFLFLISAVSVTSAIRGIIVNVTSDKYSGVLSYLFALIIVGGFWITYITIKNKKGNKNDR